MNCPVCPTSTHVMTDRAGIEIDYCPTCRGVWLDRGELDKIIERSAAPAVGTRDERRDDRRDDHRSYDKPYKKKKSSILGEIFDF